VSYLLTFTTDRDVRWTLLTIMPYFTAAKEARGSAVGHSWICRRYLRDKP